MNIHKQKSEIKLGKSEVFTEDVYPGNGEWMQDEKYGKVRYFVERRPVSKRWFQKNVRKE